MSDADSPPLWNPGLKDRILEVATCANEAEAAMVQVALNDAEIPSRVVGGSLSVIGGDVGFGMHIKPKIWVMERDAAAARKVLADIEAKRAARRANPD